MQASCRSQSLCHRAKYVQLAQELEKLKEDPGEGRKGTASKGGISPAENRESSPSPRARPAVAPRPAVSGCAPRGRRAGGASGQPRTGPQASLRAEAPRALPLGRRRRDMAQALRPQTSPGWESSGRRRGKRAPFAAPGTAAVARRL
ncbi:unnamed protein product [Rangifer tarandus platyrhynchus]|uniref:Uncharacterized protein n=2 Tax=Rangifer tarandus platyrhynchus TaxID=3082113 RepID=A0ABN8YV25_RANTA|nr:unnamed protein product [Rangifer tarandus platyrhynchus]CAI9702818.1 unnamed protein product [Rangifer tarandus platyrhynchus]